MAKNLQITKITASATPKAWSQAYHAGNLTAVITVTPNEKETGPSVAIVGKDLLNTFESEYFTIENKSLATIKEAVETTYKKSASTHTISLLVAAAIQNTLYVVLAGSGDIFLLRQGKIGTLLEQRGDKDILSSSGFLEHGDIVVLASPAFLELVDKEKLFTTLNENALADAGDLLTPTIHAASKGDAAALFLKYEDEHPSVTHKPAEKDEEKKEEKEEIKHEKEQKEEDKDKESEHKPSVHMPSVHELPTEIDTEPILSRPLDGEEQPVRRKKSGLSHQRKLLLTIVIVLLLVLGATVYFALARQKAAQQTALFTASFPTAQSKYDEGVGLLDLNVTVAKQDLLDAQQILQGLQAKLDKNSQEEKKVEGLLTQVNDKLTIASNANAVSSTKVVPSDNSVLAYALAHTDSQYITEDTANLYTINNQGITQVSKKTGSPKTIVTNTSSWKSVGGFATYLNNFYVLDTPAGIYKFAGSGSKYTKSNYLASGVNPDLSQAKDIAIDGSIWVVNSDGTILKFTKGKQDSLTISGLDKPLSSPTRIYTTVDMDNVYILDNGNARLVEIDKNGAYKAQYATGLLKNATQLTVDEKNKTATFISSGTAYQIALK